MIALVILLTGCAATPEPVASPLPTPTTNPAQVPCKGYEKLTNTMADLVVKLWTETDSEGDAEQLAGLPAEFDMLALKAEGAIADRMGATAALLTETDPIVMSIEPDAYFESIASVERACEAEGVKIFTATWS